MRLTLAFILSIFFAVGLVALGFTFYQSSTERKKLISELEIRTANVAGEVLKVDSTHFGKINRENINHFADSINSQHNLLGIAIFYNNDSILSNNSVSNLIYHSLDYFSLCTAADTSLGNFLQLKGEIIINLSRRLTRQISLTRLLLSILMPDTLIKKSAVYGLGIL